VKLVKGFCFFAREFCRKSCIEERIARGGELNMSAGFAVAAMKQRKKRKKREELEERVKKLEEEVEKLKKQRA
jgi:cell division protein FtsB